MKRSVPTLLFTLLCAVGLGLWSWYLVRGQGNPPAQVVTSRPMPAGGWGPIRVMTANVRMDDPKDGTNAWSKRRELLVKTLLKYQPDILGCQEVTPAQGAYLQKALGPWYGYYPRGGVGTQASADEGDAGGLKSVAAELLGAVSDTLASMNTFFYRTDRFEVVDGEAGLVLPKEPQANPTENTFFTLGVLREKREGAAGGRGMPETVIVVDVHFRHTEAFAVRCAQRLQEKITAWHVKYPQSGVILLGDINWDKTSKLYSTITAEQGAGGVGMLRDAFDYKKMPAGKNGSYHAFTGQANGTWPTDLIFFGGALKVTGAAEIRRDKDAAGRYPTDHFLVEAAGE